MRLGFAAQLTTARFLEVFLDDPTDVPGEVALYLAEQLGVPDASVEAKEQGWLGEFAAIEASIAAADQKFAAMRDLAAQHITVHLGMPEFRASVGRLTSDYGSDELDC